MHLSLSGFLFEDDYCSQSVALAEFCRIAASAGYEGVELRRTQIDPDGPARRRAETLRIVRDAGLTVTCLTARDLPAGGDGRDERFRRWLELCEDLRCPLL